MVVACGYVGWVCRYLGIRVFRKSIAKRASRENSNAAFFKLDDSYMSVFRF